MKNYIKVAFLFVFVAAFSFSATAWSDTLEKSYQIDSAGHLGCVPSEIQVKDLTSQYGTNGVAIWEAECRGVNYICTVGENPWNVDAAFKTSCATAK
jgi:hypothetical protein